MTNEVTELLTALQDGTMTLDEVARRFRQRPWPRRDRREPASYLEMAAAELKDSDPPVPGSFDDVADAYHQNKISLDQYRVLSQAAAEAQWATRDDDANRT
jgi:hypothetical protein